MLIKFNGINVLFYWSKEYTYDITYACECRLITTKITI